VLVILYARNPPETRTQLQNFQTFSVDEHFMFFYEKDISCNSNCVCTEQIKNTKCVQNSVNEHIQTRNAVGLL